MYRFNQPAEKHCDLVASHYGWPVMMYSDLGRRMSDKLWNETMEELRFAGVYEVLNGVIH